MATAASNDNNTPLGAVIQEADEMTALAADRKRSLPAATPDRLADYISVSSSMRFSTFSRNCSRPWVVLFFAAVRWSAFGAKRT